MAHIYFLMGVSGSGKTTVLNHSGILDNASFRYVQSYTTRPLREGEINGEKYNHITKHAFQQAIDDDEFLEWATVHQDYMYGTKYIDIVGPLASGVHTIKEIEIYGLLEIKKSKKIDGLFTTIFLDVPEEIMIQRIISRSPVSDDELEKRKESAAFERNMADEHCDHIIDAALPLDVVVQEFKQIVGLK